MHAAIICTVISMHVAMQLVDPEVVIYLFDSLYFTQGGPPLFYPSFYEIYSLVKFSLTLATAVDH